MVEVTAPTNPKETRKYNSLLLNTVGGAERGGVLVGVPETGTGVVVSERHRVRVARQYEHPYDTQSRMYDPVPPSGETHHRVQGGEIWFFF